MGYTLFFSFFASVCFFSLSSLPLSLMFLFTDPLFFSLSFFQASGTSTTFGIFNSTALLRDLGQLDTSSFSSSFLSLHFLLFPVLSLLPQTDFTSLQTDCTSFSSPQDFISLVPTMAQLP